MSFPLRRYVPILMLLPLAALLCACSGAQREPTGPVVLAASSLQGALDEAADDWAGQGHPRPVLVFAASSALARQVEQGETADLYISADEQWMDRLEGMGLTKPGSRATLLGNTLVLIAPAGTDARFDLSDRAGFDLALGRGPLAIAEPDAVPAGKYAKSALIHLGLWEIAQGKLARAENVRAALALVERGEAPLGVVYHSDAQASGKVRVIAVFPQTSHPPIRYPVALLKTSTSPDAAQFETFLATKPAQDVFARHGFSLPE